MKENVESVDAQERIDRITEERALLAKLPGVWRGKVLYHPIGKAMFTTHIRCCNGTHDTAMHAYRCAELCWFLNKNRIVNQTGGDPVVWCYETTDKEVA